MKKHLQRLSALLVFAIFLAGCAAPLGTGEPQASSDPVETAVALTLQALAPQSARTPTSAPVASTDLLPHSLYFLGNDNQAVSQIFRLERDGETKTQLTFEPTNVWDYDVSLADGSLAYEVSGELVLVNADGSNRRVLESVPNPEIHGLYRPTFSPNGQTLAYARGGLNLHSVASGVSNLVIPDQMQDPGDGTSLPVETYSPESYSPDGTKLLLALGHWEVAPSHAVYYPETDTLVRYQDAEETVYCCSFHGGPTWSADGSSFYGVASIHDSSYKFGEIWRVDAANGAVVKMLNPAEDLPKKPYLAPDGQLYFFLGSYDIDSGYFDAPVLQLVRSAPDGVTNRTVLRDENFVLMNEALWASDASFVIVANSIGRDWDMDGGVLELYYTEQQKGSLWLAPFGKEIKWGP